MSFGMGFGVKMQKNQRLVGNLVKMMAGIVELHQFRIQKRQKMAKTACARYAKMRRWKKEQRPLANTPGRLGSFSVTCFGLLDYAAHLE